MQRLAFITSLFISAASLAPSLVAASPEMCAAVFTRAAVSTQITDVVLIQAMIAINAGMDPAMFAEPVTTRLQKIAGVHSIDDLRRPEVQSQLTKACVANCSTASVDENVGKLMNSARETLKTPDRNLEAREEDLRDMQRGWGFSLLPRNDRAFADPQFLAHYLRQSRDTGYGYAGNDPARARQLFGDEWRQIAPKKTAPITFTQTGSDANNLLYTIAEKIIKTRAVEAENHAKLKARYLSNPASRPAKFNMDREFGRLKGKTEIIYMKGAYGGGRGRIAELGFMHHERVDLEIPSPFTYELNVTDPAEIKRLEPLEAAALKKVRSLVLKGKAPVGGLLLEPIAGAYGVLVYRTEFLLKLRALCDELGVPIFADEILTGGGRTGKFFAYEHYRGFQPDYITFGKGLQAAGIARVDRGRFELEASLNDITTLQGPTDALLKGSFIMKRIREGNLMQNADEMGRYFVKKLNSKAPDDLEVKWRPRGVGLLIHEAGAEVNARGAMGRLMPYLTITKDEIDSVFRK